MTYLPRIADEELTLALASMGAVAIEGPRGCGKTATARQAAASEVLLDTDDSAREMAGVYPAAVLAGLAPRLLDEWQVVPAIWNHVRRAIDDRQRPGQFILTGSAMPADDITRHTGAGRMARLRMRPMSLYETGHSNGRVSLSALLSGGEARAADSSTTVPDLIERIAVGGWPGHLARPTDGALRANRAYVGEVARADASRVDGTRRDPVRMSRLMRALARATATYTPVTTLAADAPSKAERLKDDTAHEYLEVLRRLMVIEDQPPWAPHLRSRSVLRSAPKRHFVDPSLAVAAMRATPASLLRDFELVGLLYESMVVRDLRVYAQPLDGEVLQYRDNTGMEVDAIVDAGDGRWAAFEVKLGSSRIDDAAARLLRFRERIDTSRSGAPAALGVIVGSGYSYQRDDGVAVIPIGTLGP